MSDAEDLLTVMEETDVLWIERRDGDRWTLLETRPLEALRALGVAESTRQRTGGGEYRARIRTVGGQWREQRRFSVAGAPRPVPAAETTTAAGVGASGGSAAAAASSSASAMGMPDWLKPLLGPILTAIGAGLAARMFEKPATDPLLLELIKRSTKSDGSIDPIELNRLLLEAERRGEERGREIGKLASRGDRAPAPQSGVADAVREGRALVGDLINVAQVAQARRRANGAADGAPQRRVLPARTPNATTPPAPESAVPARSTAPADIVPTWLRPFMPFRRMLIGAADNGTDAPAIAELIVKNADDATWAAMLEAEDAGRLETDLHAAIPELEETDERKAFVAALLEDLRVDLHAPTDDTDDAGDGRESEELEELEEPAPVAIAKPRKAAKKTAKREAAANG